MDLRFYVYVYLDPREPGVFTHGRLRFTHKPFYVGKGQGKRYTAHLRCRDTVNVAKNDRFKQILGAGLEPIVKFLYRTDCEESAYAMEAKIIQSIGRENLLNLTGGGVGCSSGEGHPRYGKQHSPETIKVLSEKAQNRTPEHKAKIIESRKGYVTSDETKAKISVATKGEKNPFYGQHHTPESLEKMRARVVSEENKQALRERYKNGVVTTEEARIRQKQNTCRGESHPHFGKPVSRDRVMKGNIKKVRYRYIIQFMGGTEYIAYSLKTFSKEHGLDNAALDRTSTGSTRYSNHKGYKIVEKVLLPDNWWVEYPEMLEEYYATSAYMLEELPLAA